MTAINRLKASPYWQRHKGADHLFVCSFSRCKMLLKPVRVQLKANTTSLLSIQGRLLNWTLWACPDSLIVCPYVPNSAINGAKANKKFSNRQFNFFFAGCTRKASGRDAINFIGSLPHSYIDIHDNCSDFSTTPQVYAKIISETKFCLNPRGDTSTSRRLFDSIEAGCIPILEEGHIRRSLPFTWKLDYDSFAIFAPRGALRNGSTILKFCKGLLDADQNRFEKMQSTLFKVRDDLLWGSGSPFSSKKALGKAADNVLQEAMSKVNLVKQRNWTMECALKWKWNKQRSATVHH